MGGVLYWSLRLRHPAGSAGVTRVKKIFYLFFFLLNARAHAEGFFSPSAHEYTTVEQEYNANPDAFDDGDDE